MKNINNINIFLKICIFHSIILFDNKFAQGLKLNSHSNKKKKIKPQMGQQLPHSGPASTFLSPQPTLPPTLTGGAHLAAAAPLGVPLRSLNQGPGLSVVASTNLPTMVGGSILAVSCPPLPPNSHGGTTMASGRLHP
jgi:hypothetical protein